MNDDGGDHCECDTDVETSMLGRENKSNHAPEPYNDNDGEDNFAHPKVVNLSSGLLQFPKCMLV